MQPFRKQMYQRDFDKRRSRNLRFYFDQPYRSTHRKECKGRMFALEVLPDEEGNEDAGDTGSGLVEIDNNDNVHPYISLNALAGVTVYQTMRVKGLVGKHTIHILIDSGSTYNFLDVHTAKKLGSNVVSTCPL